MEEEEKDKAVVVPNLPTLDATIATALEPREGLDNEEEWQRNAG